MCFPLEKKRKKKTTKSEDPGGKKVEAFHLFLSAGTACKTHN